MGPREGPQEIHGMWKTRYIGADVILNGFEELIQSSELVTAEALIQVFHKIRRAGNTLEVRWGPEVRRGILHRFTPNYHWLEDIEWKMNFVWNQFGDAPAPRATETRRPTEDLTVSMLNLDDILSQIPIGLLPNVTKPIKQEINSIRAGVVEINIALAKLFGKPAIQASDRQNIEALIEELIIDVDSVVDLSVNGPYLRFVPTDTVGNMLKAEIWRRDIGASALEVKVAAISARDNVRERAVPDILDIISMRPGDTLMDVARDYYGSTENWEIIADANNLVGMLVESGTRIVIPVPVQSGAGVRVES
jgi:hypothetical protein